MTAPASSAPRASLAARTKLALKRATDAVAAAVKDARQDPAPPRFPAAPFNDWGYDQAAAAVEAAIADSELDSQRALRESAAMAIPSQVSYQDPRGLVPQLTINRAFFEGDHWQQGSGWIGPHPQIGDEDFVTAMDELVAAFTSKNVIREVVKRHASGVVGKPATWSFVPRRTLAEGEVPTTEEATAIAEANRLMTAWFAARKVRSLLHDTVCTVLFAARAPLRLFIPPGLLDVYTGKDGLTRVGGIEQALGMIWPDHPVPEHAAVVQDDDTKMEAGVRLYQSPAEMDDEAEGSVAAPASGGDASDDADKIELVFLAPDGATVIRVLADEDEAADAEEYTFDFGARLTMMELRRDPLITPQVTQAQRALNLALSMLPRSVVTGGFLERVFLNAQMPGRFEKDKDGVKTGRFIPDPLLMGPSTSNFFVGVATKDAMGKESIAQPDVKWRDPVPVDAPIDAAQRHYLDILDETSQLHVVLSGDAVVSGKSREQARKEFLNSLLDTAPEAEAAHTFLLETPLAMAEALAGTPGALTSLVRAEVKCLLDTGPLEPAEIAANEASIGKTLSQETAMARNGIDDVDAEKARMAADPLARAALAKAQGDGLTALTTAGLSIDTAAEMMGIDGALAAKIKKDLAEGGFQNGAPVPKPTDTPPGGKPGDKAPVPAAGDKTAPTGGASSAAGGSE